jgi:hypothetical protein
VLKIVRKIQRADYEGNREALKRLYDTLTPVEEDRERASRIRYWRGFAMWRRALNGFNDSVDPQELERDLMLAVDEFEVAAAKDPGFVDATIGAVSCLGNVMFLNRTNAARLQELAARVGPLRQAAQAAAPHHPRLLWVLGPMLWNSPPERGGGQDKAMEAYAQALETRAQAEATDPLSRRGAGVADESRLVNGNRTTPDLMPRSAGARRAETVPHWHRATFCCRRSVMPGRHR